MNGNPVHGVHGLEQRDLLVLNIIQDHFGEQTRDVAAVLLTLRGCTLSTIVSRFCTTAQGGPSKKSRSKEDICASLLVLQQHNCLQSELPPDYSSLAAATAATGAGGLGLDQTVAKRLMPSADSRRIIYSINTNMVLNRLRIGRMVFHAGHTSNLGRIGELLIEELFMNGRQSFQQLRADVDARARAEPSLQSEQTFKNIQISFDALVSRGYLKKVDKLELKRQVLLKLPPKSRGAKNKRHLQGSFSAPADSNKQRRGNDRDDDDDDDDDEDDFFTDEDDEELPDEMRPNRNRGRSDSFLANRGWIGDGEWKEDCGFGPVTEEIIYDAEKIACSKREERVALEREMLNADNIRETTVKVEDLTGDDFSILAPSKQPSTSVGSLVRRVGLDDDGDDDDDVDDGDDNSNNDDHGHDEMSGTEQKLKMDRLQMAPVDERGGLWTIEWDQLFNEERHSACVRFATERMQAKAGRIVKIILDGSSAQFQTYQTPITSTEASLPMSLIGIYDEFKRRSAAEVENASSGVAGGSVGVGDKNLDLPTLKKLLQVLVEDNILVETILYATSPSGARESKSEFRVKVGTIINKLKRKTYHSIASTRFGVSTARVVELMTTNSELMEQQRLSDLAIMPGREAREILYKLYKDKWIDYHDIPKRSDYNPASTLYFWSLDQARLKNAVLDHCYKSVLNLRIKYVFCCCRRCLDILFSHDDR